MVGHLFQAEVRHVRHEDAELGGVVDRDVVETNPIPGDKQAAGRGVERLWGHALPVGQDRIGVGRERHELVVPSTVGNDEFGPYLSEDAPLDVERRPRVVGDKNSRRHAGWLDVQRLRTPAKLRTKIAAGEEETPTSRPADRWRSPTLVGAPPKRAREPWMHRRRQVATAQLRQPGTHLREFAVLARVVRGYPCGMGV